MSSEEQTTTTPPAAEVVPAGEIHRRVKAWEAQVATLTESAQRAAAERDALAAQVAELKARSEAASRLESELSEIRTRYDGLTLEVQRERGLRTVGIDPADPRADSLVKHWRREMAEAAEDKRAGFDQWLASARESDPIVSALIGRPATTAPASTSTGAAADPARRPVTLADLQRQQAELIKQGKHAEARAVLDQMRALRPR